MARNVTVAGTGHGPKRHGAGRKTSKVRSGLRACSRSRVKAMDGRTLETGTHPSIGNTTKARERPGEHGPSLGTLTGPGRRHRFSDNGNPRGRSLGRRHDQATGTATCPGETSRRASERDERWQGSGRKKALKGEPEECQPPETRWHGEKRIKPLRTCETPGGDGAGLGTSGLESDSSRLER